MAREWGRLPAAGAAALVALVGTAAVATAGDRGMEVVHVEVARPLASDNALAAGRPASLRFHALGRDFLFELEPREELLSPSARVTLVGTTGERPGALPVAWRGRSADGSEARVRVGADGAVNGVLVTPEGLLVVEPAPGHDRGAHLVRDAGSALSDPAAMLPCGGTGLAPLSASPAADTDVASMGAPLPGGRVVELSLVADAAFFRAHGEDSAAAMLALAAHVDDVFRSDLGVAVEVTAMVVYEDEAVEPFPATSLVGELLTPVSMLRRDGASFGGGRGAVSHLLTGRKPSDAMGMSWLGGACDEFYGAGVSAVDATSDFLAAVVVAHELGHSLGASHDGVAGSACEATPTGYVMSRVLRSDLLDHFSPCSVEVLSAALPTFACTAAVVADSCGNGALDEGEDCDASAGADEGCCRPDCRFRAAGLACGDSGVECLDAACDGEGACTLVPNHATCAGEDSCVVSRCSEGACVAGDEGRGFVGGTVSMRVGSDGMVESGKAKLSLALPAAASDPREAGFLVRARLGGAMAWEEFVPPALWVERGSGKYAYSASVVSTGRVRSGRVRYDAARGVATVKLGLAHPMSEMGVVAPDLLVLAGDRPDGACGNEVLSSCSLRGGTMRCE